MSDEQPQDLRVRRITPQHASRMLTSLSRESLESILASLDLEKLPPEQRQALRGRAAEEALRIILGQQEKAGDLSLLSSQVSTLADHATQLITEIGAKSSVKVEATMPSSLGTTKITIDNTAKGKMGCASLILLVLIPSSVLTYLVA